MVALYLVAPAPPGVRLREQLLGLGRLCERSCFIGSETKGLIGGFGGGSGTAIEDLEVIAVRWTILFIETIQAGQGDGSFDPVVDPVDMASLFVTGCIGAAASMRLLKSEKPIEDFTQSVFLLVRPGPGGAAAVPKIAPMSLSGGLARRSDLP